MRSFQFDYDFQGKKRHELVHGDLPAVCYYVTLVSGGYFTNICVTEVSDVESLLKE